MDILLKVLQGILASVMHLPGFMKLANNNAQLIEKGNGRMNWVEDVSETNMKIIGVLEVMAALGLILPMMLGLYPILTTWAAVGVVLTMAGAISLHLKRGDEPKSWMITVMILLIACFVAYGRFILLPA